MLITELLAGLTAKLAGLGMAAKATLGLTLAAASVTTAGAVGVLPAPVQHAVATVVDTATPFTFPDEADANADLGAEVSTDATGSADGTVGVDGSLVSGDDAATDDDAGTNNGVGPSESGATGLDRANETPAAGHVPTSLPAATNGDGAQGGLDTANGTPAAGHAPTSLPAAASGAGAQGGIDKANETPAVGHLPANAPGRP